MAVAAVGAADAVVSAEPERCTNSGRLIDGEKSRCLCALDHSLSEMTLTS